MHSSKEFVDKSGSRINIVPRISPEYLPRLQGLLLYTAVSLCVGGFPGPETVSRLGTGDFPPGSVTGALWEPVTVREGTVHGDMLWTGNGHTARRHTKKQGRLVVPGAPEEWQHGLVNPQSVALSLREHCGSVDSTGEQRGSIQPDRHPNHGPGHTGRLMVLRSQRRIGYAKAGS
ncbi:hypothetical protein DPEC_G00162370 [Dallia pectoralis]|uniref:Uncharacterized protein n=1 Tax=Dallia pectoralis TaxID=75939 RepID=A0ACC2GH02_DALPE|nr:hypothetical protein DPEC_G00162370 [Dallia pectoralis]